MPATPRHKHANDYCVSQRTALDHATQLTGIRRLAALATQPALSRTAFFFFFFFASLFRINRLRKARFGPTIFVGSPSVMSRRDWRSSGAYFSGHLKLFSYLNINNFLTFYLQSLFTNKHERNRERNKKFVYKQKKQMEKTFQVDICKTILAIIE